MGYVSENNMNSRMHQLERNAAKYYKKYRPLMNILEKSPLSRIRDIDKYDVYCLGQQLEQFEEFCKMAETQGSISNLGQIPTVGFDVISVAYGTSVLPMIASVQPIMEESGIVWFRNVQAGEAKGSHTKYEDILDPTKLTETPYRYAGSGVYSETVITVVEDDLDYSTTLAKKPLKRGSVVIYRGTTAVGWDDQNGRINGQAIWGTVDYETGVLALNIPASAAVNTAVGNTYTANYQEDYEGADDVPSIRAFWESKNITAQTYALKGVTGMFQNYAMQKRFGTSSSITEDLISALNAELGGVVIRMLNDAAVDNVNYADTKPSEISFFEHRQGFMDPLTTAETNLIGNAGRGTISVLIAGNTGAKVIQGVNGFTKTSSGVDMGPHLFGNLSGIPVIRVPDSTTLNANTILGVWKGTSPFEAAAVYSPYMPLTTTDYIGTGQNPLNRQQAAVVWAGIDILVPNFITKITIT